MMEVKKKYGEVFSEGDLVTFIRRPGNIFVILDFRSRKRVNYKFRIGLPGWGTCYLSELRKATQEEIDKDTATHVAWRITRGF